MKEYNRDEMIARIFNLMRKRHMTGRAFAEGVGMAPSTCHDWKAGKGTPKVEYIAKTAQFFGVSTDYLIFGEDEEEIKLRIIKAQNLEEQSLLDRYREMPENLRSMVNAYVNGIASGMSNDR